MPGKGEEEEEERQMGAMGEPGNVLKEPVRDGRFFLEKNLSRRAQESKNGMAWNEAA